MLLEALGRWWAKQQCQLWLYGNPDSRPYIVSSNIATATAPITFLKALGGGIRNSFLYGNPSGAAAVVLVRSSTISGNQAVNGGGLGNSTIQTPNSTASVLLGKSTMRDNIALGQGDTLGNGGGIDNFNGLMLLVNSTVSGNEANGNGSSTSGLGGGIVNGSWDVSAGLWLTNTTVSSGSLDVHTNQFQECDHNRRRFKFYVNCHFVE